MPKAAGTFHFSHFTLGEIPIHFHFKIPALGPSKGYIAFASVNNDIVEQKAQTGTLNKSPGTIMFQGFLLFYKDAD